MNASEADGGEAELGRSDRLLGALDEVDRLGGIDHHRQHGAHEVQPRSRPAEGIMKGYRPHCLLDPSSVISKSGESDRRRLSEKRERVSRTSLPATMNSRMTPPSTSPAALNFRSAPDSSANSVRASSSETSLDAPFGGAGMSKGAPS